MRTQSFNTLKTIALAIIFSIGLSYVYAWTAPTATPPGGNVSAPINTSATAQTKTGGFNIATVAGSVGIGTPSPSQKLTVAGVIDVTGGITSLGTITTNGLKITNGAVAGKVLTSDASGNASWGTTPQARVTGSCAVGQAIKAINADGTVTCESAGVASYNNLPPGATAGHCLYVFSEESGVNSYIAPATAVSNTCSCATGFTLVMTGSRKFLPNVTTWSWYTCIKN